MQSVKHLAALGLGKLLSRDDSDFLLLVELLVKLLVLLTNVLNEDETLVLGQHGQEVMSDIVEGSGLPKGLVKKSDFLNADTSVLGELTEDLGVSVELGQVHHILIDLEEGVVLGGSCEEHVGVATLDSVLVAGSLVVRS